MTKANPELARKFLLIGALMAPIGIALAATGRPDVASIIALPGIAFLIAGLHTFGRAGADPGR